MHSDNRRKNVLYQTTIQVYSEKFLAPVSDDILHLPFHRVVAIPVEVWRCDGGEGIGNVRIGRVVFLCRCDNGSYGLAVGYFVSVVDDFR